jgi:transcriptional regulator GlxA family with amidase domain
MLDLRVVAFDGPVCEQAESFLHDDFRAISDMPRRVVAIAYEGFLLLDLAGPLGALEVASYHAPDGYAVELTSVHGGIVHSSAGIGIATVSFTAGVPVDLLIVPGGLGSMEAATDESVLTLIRDVASHARRTASVCSGAFLLAAAGMLDGKKATTHWGGVTKLQRDYPRVAVDGDSIFIEDGNVWTSAGITAGIDLALALIERDHGFAVAQQVAQGLVVYHRRPGGQRQFSAALQLQGPDGRFGALLDWARERLQERLDVERLADQCSLSPRHFSRAFAAATGLSPGRAIEKLRVDHARPDVLRAEESLETVARRYGFGSAARMRRSFVRILGYAPQFLRRES